MSTDERRRAAQRAAQADPTDPLAVARAEVEHARSEQTEADWIRETLLGRWVLIEGARMNYRGLLAKLFYDGATGAVRSLLLADGRRVTHWRSSGPEHEERLGEILVPASYVHAINLQPARWPTS